MTYLSNKGCFGSVICNDSKNKVCMDCTLFSSCTDIKEKNIKEISDEGVVNASIYDRRAFQHRVELSLIDDSFLPRSSTREIITEHQLKILENKEFSVKSRKIVASLFRKGMSGKYISNLLLSNINPFLNSTPVILDIACRLILVNKLNLGNLRIAFRHSGQKDKTALSQAHTTITAFMMLGVLDENFKLRR